MRLRELGTHILLSLYGIQFDLLDNATELRGLFDRVAEAIGATVLNKFSYKFTPQGVTVLFCLAESHLSLHSFPERGCVAIDCYTCGSMNTQLAADMFVEYFNPVEVSMQEIKR